MATLASFAALQGLLLLFSLLHDAAHSSTELVNRTCAHLKVFDMVDFCVVTLESDSRTATANLTDLGHISFGLAIANASDTRVYIKQLREEAKGKRLGLCLQGCEELYGNVFYDAEQGGKALQEKKYDDMIKWGVAIAVEADRCEQGFRHHPPMKYSPLSQRNKDMMGIHLIIVYIAEMLLAR